MYSYEVCSFTLINNLTKKKYSIGSIGPSSACVISYLWHQSVIVFHMGSVWSQNKIQTLMSAYKDVPHEYEVFKMRMHNLCMFVQNYRMILSVCTDVSACMHVHTVCMYFMIMERLLDHAVGP